MFDLLQYLFTILIDMYNEYQFIIYIYNKNSFSVCTVYLGLYQV